VREWQPPLKHVARNWSGELEIGLHQASPEGCQKAFYQPSTRQGTGITRHPTGQSILKSPPL
jgi:hypothetical protein